jgi:hypothetical protein
MMRWPIPEDKLERRSLIMHELFHRLQAKLKMGWHSDNNENSHLNTLEGRYYLQLEFRALKRALQSYDKQQCINAVQDALIFRERRYQLFPKAANEEQALELDEGLAEYTGDKLADTDADKQRNLVINEFEKRSTDTTFVRSFAYATGPAYGFLLDQFDPKWRQKIVRKGEKSLSNMLAKAISFKHRSSIPESMTDAAAQRYDGSTLRKQEIERQEKNNRILATNKSKFTTGPILRIKLSGKRSIQFDPRNLQPLENLGTVYPSARITDEFGILEVSDGALVNALSNEVIVVAPSKNVEGPELTGDGWKLSLKQNWRIVPEGEIGNYRLTRF